MFNIGPAELLVILLVALLVVGPAKLPQLGRTIGKSLREFRRSADELKSHLEFDPDEDAEHPDGHGAGLEPPPEGPPPDAEPE